VWIHDVEDWTGLKINATIEIEQADRTGGVARYWHGYLSGARCKSFACIWSS